MAFPILARTGSREFLLVRMGRPTDPVLPPLRAAPGRRLVGRAWQGRDLSRSGDCAAGGGGPGVSDARRGWLDWRCSRGYRAAAMGSLKDELLKAIWHAFTALDLDHSGKVSKSQLKVGVPARVSDPRPPRRALHGVESGPSARSLQCEAGRNAARRPAPGRAGRDWDLVCFGSLLPSGQCVTPLSVPHELGKAAVGSLSRERGSLLARGPQKVSDSERAGGGLLRQPTQSLPLTLGREGICRRSPGRALFGARFTP